jgi:hypothetical protein
MVATDRSNLGSPPCSPSSTQSTTARTIRVWPHVGGRALIQAVSCQAHRVRSTRCTTRASPARVRRARGATGTWPRRWFRVVSGAASDGGADRARRCDPSMAGSRSHAWVTLMAAGGAGVSGWHVGLGCGPSVWRGPLAASLLRAQSSRSCVSEVRFLLIPRGALLLRSAPCRAHPPSKMNIMTCRRKERQTSPATPSSQAPIWPTTPPATRAVPSPLKPSPQYSTRQPTTHTRSEVIWNEGSE